MSNPNEPSDNSKPVIRDTNPHNYRKVGYSLIVISVSLVAIGLLVLLIGQNYHFSGDLMAEQEIDSMTPKKGYNLIVFDYTQPVGAKLNLLNHADDIAYAVKLKTESEKEYLNQKGIVLIFDNSQKNNSDSIALAEVFVMTPTNGYNIISFNNAFPPGAKLSSLKLDPTISDAEKDVQANSDQNKDSGIKILTLTTSYDDNLQQILGVKYNQDVVSKNINQFKIMSPKLIVPKPQTPTPNLSGTNQTKITLQNATMVNPVNATMVNPVNATTVVNSTKLNTQTPIVNNTGLS